MHLTQSDGANSMVIIDFGRKSMKSARLLLLASALLAALGCAAGASAAEPTCISAGCHETLLKAKVVHAAAEGCDACHESVATPHPQKGKKTFKLGQPVAALCATCHDAFKKAHVHAPVKDGDCATCHNPHSSNEPKLLTSPVKDLCGACHADHTEFKVVHGPVSAGECTICHTPHESAAKGLLLKPSPGLCFGCHSDVEQGLKKKVVHAAVEGGCTSCHNPHGSAFPKLVAKAGAGVCYDCHSGIEDELKKATSPHAPVNSPKGCASCHSPHASDGAKLLPASEKVLCLGCHKAVLTKAMTVLHGPVAKDQCTPCHKPHGSPNAHLLVKSFSAEPYLPYTDTAYELCFGCHNRDLLRFPDTSFATKFRDGERNLHFLHVNNKLKGRNCKLCHAVHGADNASLIAASVPFGQWSLPIKFVKSEDGGSCAPGCHRPFTYARKGTASKPEPAPAPAPKKK